jgi:hypothetical protein
MNKTHVTIRETICTGLERDWEFIFDTEDKAEEATKNLPYNCHIVEWENRLIRLVTPQELIHARDSINLD